MSWRIVHTTDNQHLGTVIESIEPGQILTFSDGDVVAINQVFKADDGRSVIAVGTNYQLTLTKE
jgi:hypothetical protein